MGIILHLDDRYTSISVISDVSGSDVVAETSCSCITAVRSCRHSMRAFSHLELTHAVSSESARLFLLGLQETIIGVLVKNGLGGRISQCIVLATISILDGT